MSESIKTVSEGGAAQQVNVERLLEPVRLGPYDLPSRLVMAPLTRSRARQPGNVPFSLNACYYEQRASAALIISEATQVSQQGQGYAWTPGIHSLEQVEGWKLVTSAVHKANGLIFLQLCNVGRISHPSRNRMECSGSPSAIAQRNGVYRERTRRRRARSFVTPRLCR
jgi:N-ethylmaleimide reductase